MTKYDAHGTQAEFEPQSNGLVLRNLLGITRVADMEMADFERTYLVKHTPCNGMAIESLARALAITHAELIIIHPFREGNGRCARLLAWLMAMQAGWPPLDFSPLSGRYLQDYILSIHAAFRGDYTALEARFLAVLKRTERLYGKSPQVAA